MQTDPNFSNFLWNARTRQVELVDFGATREYSRVFIDRWLRLLRAAAADDTEGAVRWSRELGYLTGEENEVRDLFCLLPSLIQADAHPFSSFSYCDTGYDGCARSFHLSPWHTLPVLYTSTVLLRPRLDVDANYARDSRTDPSHAPAPAHAASAGDILPQSVSSLS
jgi:hypothetical protein